MVILSQIFQVCIIPLLGALTVWLIQYINAKRDETLMMTDNELAKKYIEMLTATITDCVLTTNQTYVDSLKAQGKFDADAQKEAFNRTFKAVMSILSEDALEYLRESLGDLEQYITNKIESEVNKNKNGEV